MPLYDTLGDEAISFILMQSEIKLIVCDNSKKALDLMKRKSKLEHIIIFDDITDEVRDKAAESSINVLSFEELKGIGRKNLVDFVVSLVLILFNRIDPSLKRLNSLTASWDHQFGANLLHVWYNWNAKGSSANSS